MAASSPSKTRARPSNPIWSMPATLTTAPSGASEPLRTAMPPCAWIGSPSAWTTSPSGEAGPERGEVVGHRPAGDGDAVPVEQAGSEQLRHDHRHAADPVEIGHVVLPVRLGVGQVGDPGGDPVEVVEAEIHPRLVGDGQQMEHGVGGPPERHGDGDGVLERLLGHHVPGADAGPEQCHHRLARGEGGVVAPPVDGGSRRAAGESHAEGLGHRGHGVGREHPGTRPLGRAGVVLDEAQLLVGERVHGVGPDRLEHRGDVEGTVSGPPREDRSRRRGRRSGG